ncbi:MAG: hypothetical protein KKD44_05750 [Proteobacteria bacterium]|nr:hypothetical protein [Pseudomonadota bacterium]
MLFTPQYTHEHLSIDGVTCEGALFQSNSRQMLISIHGVADYLVEVGPQVTIRPHPNASEQDITLFADGLVYAVLLLQKREYLPLHAGAIETPQGAVLICGASGSGKSSLIASFVKRGFRFLSDDTSPVKVNEDGNVITLPYLPQLKLSRDSAAMSGFDTVGLQPIRRDAKVDKFYLDLSDCFSNRASPVRTVYVLMRHSGTRLGMEKLSMAEKMKVLLNRTNGFPFIKGLGLSEWHFKRTADLATRLDIKRIRRPDGQNTHTQITDLIMRDLQL